MPISAGDFRKGVVFEMDGKPMLVVDATGLPSLQ